VLNALDHVQREGISAPAFDESRHAGVCMDLKFLYVAITRARKNLWIVDNSEKSGPMRVCIISHSLTAYAESSTDVLDVPGPGSTSHTQF
jgi:ATP-dependent exoDNAse (exonuclease V) beta subunit